MERIAEFAMECNRTATFIPCPMNSRCLSLLLGWSLLACGSAPAAEPSVAEPTGQVAPATRALIEKAVQAAGGEANLLRYFRLKDRVQLGAMDTGAGSKRESVLDAPRAWWLKSGAGFTDRTGEPAKFLVWGWTLRALVDPTSTVEAVPSVRDGDVELWGLRVSGSVKPAMELYFHPDTQLLARLDWRSDIHRFSDWKTLPGGGKYSARIVGFKKTTGNIWYFDDVLEVVPLASLPDALPPVTPPAR